jgi:hypothetical protein
MKKGYWFRILLIGGLISMACSLSAQLPQATRTPLPPTAMASPTSLPLVPSLPPAPKGETGVGNPPPGSQATQPAVPVSNATLAPVAKNTSAPDTAPTLAPLPNQTAAPSAAPIANQTTTPAQSAATPPGSLIAQDDFSQANGLWDKVSGKDFSIDYSNGELLFTNLAANNLIWDFYKSNLDLSDTQMSVDARVVKGTSGYFGVLCRYLDPQNFYALLVSSDGQYSIQKDEKNSWTNLVNWTASSAIPVGKPLNILAYCSGDQISIGVNGTWLTTVKDSTFVTGEVGLVNGTSTTPQNTVAFDNFNVYTPSATYPNRQLAAQDDFSQSSKLWDIFSEQTDSVAFAKGELLFTVSKANYLIWSPYQSTADYSNVQLSVDAREVSGSGDYGFLCRYQDSNNYYLIAVTSDGKYTIQKNVAGTWTALRDWTVSDKIPKGQPMNIEASCMGTQLAIGINNTWIDQVTDDTFITGQVALTTGAFQDPNHAVAFDNFKIYQP